jgi:4-hydroxybenzoate polyprenyltransferase
LRMGARVRPGVGLFYGAALLFWAGALWSVRPQFLALVALLPATLHLGWQVMTLKTDDGADPLNKFRSNRFAGLLVALACLVVGSSA